MIGDTKYDGYIGEDSNGDIFGTIVLDNTDDIYKTIIFTVSINDYTVDYSDARTLYNSAEVQSILNNFEFNVAK